MPLLLVCATSVEREKITDCERVSYAAMLKRKPGKVHWMPLTSKTRLMLLYLAYMWTTSEHCQKSLSRSGELCSGLLLFCWRGLQARSTQSCSGVCTLHSASARGAFQTEVYAAAELPISASSFAFSGKKAPEFALGRCGPQ